MSDSKIIMNKMNEIMDLLPIKHRKLLWDFVAGFTAMQQVIEQFGLKDAVEKNLKVLMEELGFVD